MWFFMMLFYTLVLLFLYTLELRAAPLDGLEEFTEVVLEVRQHLVSVVLCAKPDLALPTPGVLHDLCATLLCPFEDLLLGGDLLCLVLGAADDAVALAARLVEHRLALLDDPSRLFEFLGDRLAHLVYDVEGRITRSEEHTSELQSRQYLVCR